MFLLPVGSVVPQPCFPAADMLGIKWGVAEPLLLCSLLESLIHQRPLKGHGEAMGGWQGLVHTRDVGHSALLRGEVFPRCEWVF